MKIIEQIRKLQEAAKKSGIVVTDILEDGTVVQDLPAVRRTYRLNENDELELKDEEVKTAHASKEDAAADIVDSIIKGDFEAAHEALDDYLKLYASEKAEEEETEEEEEAEEAEEDTPEEDAEENAEASGVDEDSLMPAAEEDEEDEESLSEATSSGPNKKLLRLSAKIRKLPGLLHVEKVTADKIIVDVGDAPTAKRVMKLVDENSDFVTAEFDGYYSDEKERYVNLIVISLKKKMPKSKARFLAALVDEINQLGGGVRANKTSPNEIVVDVSSKEEEDAVMDLAKKYDDRVTAEAGGYYADVDRKHFVRVVSIKYKG